MIIFIYILAMVSANLLVWGLGPWSSPLIAFVLIGLDLTLRDVLQERILSVEWRRSLAGSLQMLAVIVLGGLITWLLNPSASNIAIASATAFAVSALADWIAYSLLRRKSWLVRANGSNVVGAAFDSAIFPTLAFGAFLPHIILLQFAAKVGGGAMWAYVFSRRGHPGQPRIMEALRD